MASCLQFFLISIFGGGGLRQLVSAPIGVSHSFSLVQAKQNYCFTID